MVLAVTIGLTTSVSVASVGERGSALLLGAITCVMLVSLAVVVLVRQSSASHRERVIHRLQVRRLEDELAAASASAAAVLEDDGRECRRARVRRSRAARRGR